jgi:cell division transport system permease protein
MELVGASWEFISKPYLRRSFWHGLLSGLAAVAGLGGLIALALQQAPEFESLLNWTGLTIIFSSLLCLGVLIPVVGTYYVVNKYLRMRVDDLY